MVNYKKQTYQVKTTNRQYTTHHLSGTWTLPIGFGKPMATSCMSRMDYSNCEMAMDSTATPTMSYLTQTQPQHLHNTSTRDQLENELHG